MKRAPVSRLLTPRLSLYFILPLCFSIATLFFDRRLAALEFAVTIICIVLFAVTAGRRRQSALRYIDDVSDTVVSGSRDLLLNSPLPMVLFDPVDEEVIWSNDRFLKIVGDREHLFDTRITEAVRGFSPRWLLEGKTVCPSYVTLAGRRYQVFGSILRQSDNEDDLLATTFWMDVTELADARDRFLTSRPVMALLVVDNYEELFRNSSDNARSALMAQIDERIEAWVAPAKGILCRYDRDRYLFFFENQYLDAFIKEKFSILSQIRALASANGLHATLSIGIGKEAETLEELFHFASLSLDMALSRGGDQAVMKTDSAFDFFGSQTRETEKRTKVKARVISGSMAALIRESSEVLVMGHRYSDMDSIGAAAGICALVRKLGRPVHIVMDSSNTLAGTLLEHLQATAAYREIFLDAQDALARVDARTLLVVVDTNRPEQTECPELLLACPRIAVIDHHHRAATYISNAMLNFHEPYASSAAELVTELLSYLTEPADLMRQEAEALLAGIMLDTKNFALRTGTRTFEAAALLRRAGADPTQVKLLFRNDLNSMISKYDIIRTASIYKNGIAIATAAQDVGRVSAAQAADEMLSISGVSASFVLYPSRSSTILSARSSSAVNVQIICEALGGGGNGAAAGAQLEDTTPGEALSALKSAIDRYLAEDAKAQNKS